MKSLHNPTLLSSTSSLTLFVLALILTLIGGCTIEEETGGSTTPDADASSDADQSDGGELCTPGDEQTAPAPNDCNTCTCTVSGAWACTQVACAPDACTETECGPAPGAPNYLCEDGVTTAGPGACTRNADGVCGWEYVECPPPAEGCYGDQDCTTPGQTCNAGDVCLGDPSCPACDVCYGWCVDETTCSEGDTQPAPDGCNTCTCQADGSWACTEIGCTPTGECVTDDDCIVTGCSGQLCAAEDISSTCEWREEYACYNDANTSCGCNEGVCGWAATPALDECLSSACVEGESRPAEDGCNTCTCQGDGSWACTEMACEPSEGCYGDEDCTTPGQTCNAGDVCLSDPSCPACTVCYGWCVDETTCSEGDTQPAPDGCNTCTCQADGSWACTEMACASEDESLCASTGGTWDPTSCGHYSCGFPPDCDAIFPGCDCGAGQTFVDGEGCAADPSCPN